MKKLLLFLVVGLASISITFAYNPSLKDQKILNSIYSKIDKIYEKDSTKIEKLYDKLVKIESTLKIDSRGYYIISELSDYIEELISDDTTEKTSNILNSIENLIYNPNDKSYLDKGYKCGEKTKYCKYMDSCDEVKFYYYQCGAKTFDGDKDGIPCENICGSKYK